LLTALAYYAALGAERARLVATAERVEAERRVERLRSALLTAVSHDLRTPLTTIKGIANEIRHGANPENAAVIEQEADWLDGLVGDLLDLSRIQAGAVRPVLEVNTLEDLVGTALRRAAAALEGRRVDVDNPRDEMLAGVFDFSQSLRALVNLLDNAAKYTPPGTRVYVSAASDGPFVRVTVDDDGPGLPPGDPDDLFEKFRRGEREATVVGAGLGLAICRAIVRAHGGTIVARRRPGRGARFELTLPIAEPRA
jgi:two-component system sensor histidine kinase KdpD